jgi:ketopantoate hydroxymethyltransferase
MEALRQASKALAKSVPSLPEPEKSKAQEAIDKIEDQMDDLAVADLAKVTKAVRRAADRMEAVLDAVNTHATQQISAQFRGALATLREQGADA